MMGYLKLAGKGYYAGASTLCFATMLMGQSTPAVQAPLYQKVGVSALVSLYAPIGILPVWGYLMAGSRIKPEHDGLVFRWCPTEDGKSTQYYLKLVFLDPFLSPLASIATGGKC
jgi:hypothetical protein